MASLPKDFLIFKSYPQAQESYPSLTPEMYDIALTTIQKLKDFHPYYVSPNGTFEKILRTFHYVTLGINVLVLRGHEMPILNLRKVREIVKDLKCAKEVPRELPSKFQAYAGFPRVKKSKIIENKKRSAETAELSSKI